MQIYRFVSQQKIFPKSYMYLPINDFSFSEWDEDYIPTQSQNESPPVDSGQPHSVDSPDDIQPGLNSFCVVPSNRNTKNLYDVYLISLKYFEVH